MQKEKLKAKLEASRSQKQKLEARKAEQQVTRILKERVICIINLSHYQDTIYSQWGRIEPSTSHKSLVNSIDRCDGGQTDRSQAQAFTSWSSLQSVSFVLLLQSQKPSMLVA